MLSDGKASFNLHFKTMRVNGTLYGTLWMWSVCVKQIQKIHKIRDNWFFRWEEGMGIIISIVAFISI